MSFAPFVRSSLVADSSRNVRGELQTHKLWAMMWKAALLPQTAREGPWLRQKDRSRNAPDLCGSVPAGVAAGRHQETLRHFGPPHTKTVRG